MRPRCVLTIAGSDSGAGAGVQADARTIHALGGYALTVITAVTAQNTRGVRAWRAVPVPLLRAQLLAVFEDFDIRAVKTGLLPGAAAIREVTRVLTAHPHVPLVVDPVIASTSGTRFLSGAALTLLKSLLLPRATVVTPNWPEAAALTGAEVASEADAVRCATGLSARFGCAVLVKGGHSDTPSCCDVLAAPGAPLRRYAARRLATRNTHGTGCVLSAAIAAGLARRKPVAEAVGLAHAFLQRALREGTGWRLGHGHGPAFAGIRTGTR